MVTVKYVFVTMRAENRGEDASFALLALVQRVTKKSPVLPWIAADALIATAHFYGDAAINPATSILSAAEGMQLLGPGLERYVIRITLVIIVGLFAIQRFGTGVVGALFGPVMLVWFVTISVLGANQVIRHPGVLAALNPGRAGAFFLDDPIRAFFTLGSVVLAITGAEALYADLGHFGRSGISHTWLWIALPALLRCYARQSALVLVFTAWRCGRWGC